MELKELRDWRKQEFGSQGAMAEFVGRDQHAVSRWERGLSLVPAEVRLVLRERGYNGSFSDEGPGVGELDLRGILAEAQEIVAEIEAREKRAMAPARRAELLTLVAEEVREAAVRGKPESARDRVARWWSLTGGSPK